MTAMTEGINAKTPRPKGATWEDATKGLEQQTDKQQREIEFYRKSALLVDSMVGWRAAVPRRIP
jgi:hypothetical protein